MASCQNRVFSQWATAGGLPLSAINTVTIQNDANAAAVQAGQKPALEARLALDVLMEQAVLRNPPSYAPNPQIVPSALLGWEQQQECHSRYAVPKRLYVYEAICDNAALLAWGRCSHITAERLIPLMKGALSASYETQSQKISPAEVSRQVLVLARNSGLAFSGPHGSGAYAFSSLSNNRKRDLTP